LAKFAEDTNPKLNSVDKPNGVAVIHIIATGFNLW
jgi:hypothetical protein